MVFELIRCVGQAASMGSLLLAAGEAGMRHSLPNSRIMIHQPSGGAQVRLYVKVYLFLPRSLGSNVIEFYTYTGASNRYSNPS